MACSTKCNDYEVVVREVNEKPRNMGLDPAFILDSLNSSFKFWKYQSEQEIIILNSIIDRLEHEKNEYEKTIVDKEMYFKSEYESMKDKYSKLRDQYEKERELNKNLYLEHKKMKHKYCSLISKLQKCKMNKEIFDEISKIKDQ